MTTPSLGDLPDWQQLSAPNIVTSVQVNIAAGANIIIANALNPLRMWGAWLDVAVASGSTFVAIPSQWGAQIQDENGTPYIRVECEMAAVSHEANVALFVPLLGVQAPAVAGVCRMRLVTDAAITGLTTRVNAGLLLSNP